MIKKGLLDEFSILWYFFMLPQPYVILVPFMFSISAAMSFTTHIETYPRLFHLHLGSVESNLIYTQSRVLLGFC